MLKRVLTSLTDLVDKDVRDWIAENEKIRELRYSMIRRKFVQLSEHPVRACIVLCVIGCILSVLGIWIPVSALKGLDYRFADEGAFGYFGHVWSLQATVAGLVYPIVISFVAVLIQRRRNASASLGIYLRESLAILSGLSALALLVVMTLQYWLMPFISNFPPGNKGVLVLTLIDLVWLAVNLVMTSYFLFVTFNFVQPSKRREISIHHLSNIVLPQELRDLLTSFRYEFAVQHNILPGPSYGSDSQGMPGVMLGSSMGRHGEVDVERRLSGTGFLVDARFAMLAWVARRWQRRASKRERTSDAQYARTDLLIFSAEPGRAYRKSVALVRVAGGEKLQRLEKVVVQLAFSFSNRNYRPGIRVIQITEDLVAEAVSALAAGELRIFRETEDEYVEVVAIAIEACSFTNDLGELDNYSQLQRGFRAVYEEWTGGIRELSESAAGVLSRDPRYFREVMSAPRELYSQLLGKIPRNLRKNLMRSFLDVYYPLRHWWNNEHGVSGDGGTLGRPLDRIYKKTLSDWIGVLETSKNFMLLPAEDKLSDWSVLAREWGPLEEHLQLIALMLVDSVNAGDEMAAHAYAASLFQWLQQGEFRIRARGYGVRNEDLVTVSLFELDWEGVKSRLGSNGEEEFIQDRLVEVDVFYYAVNNYWKDALLVTAFVLVRMVCRDLGDKRLGVRVVRAILGLDTVEDVDGKAARGHLIEGMDRFFLYLIRESVWHGGYRRGYPGQIDELAERLTQTFSRPMVAGRMYSEFGGHGLDAHTDASLMLGCLLVSEEWEVRAANSVVQLLLGVDDDSLRSLERLLEKWISRLRSEEFQRLKNCYSILAQNENDNDFEERCEQFAVALEKFREAIGVERANLLRELPIDRDRLREIEEWAEPAFSSDNTEFPINLFGGVHEGEDDSDDFVTRTLRITGMERGLFTNVEMAQRSSNEESWFKRTISDHVAGSVLSQLLSSIVDPLNVATESAMDYWSVLKKYKAKVEGEGMDSHPLLFLSSRLEPTWVREWLSKFSYQTPKFPRPDDLVLDKDEGFAGAAGYLGTLAGIAVFDARIWSGCSFLLRQDSLRSIEFQRFDTGRFLRAEIEPIDGEPAKVNLRLQWRMRLQVGEVDAVKITYSQESDNEG